MHVIKLNPWIAIDFPSLSPEYTNNPILHQTEAKKIPFSSLSSRPEFARRAKAFENIYQTEFARWAKALVIIYQTETNKHRGFIGTNMPEGRGAPIIAIKIGNNGTLMFRFQFSII